MKLFRLSSWLYVGLLFSLVACQPVTRRPEKLLATAVEQKPAVMLTAFSPKPFKPQMSISFGSEWSVAEEYADVFTITYTGHDAGLSFINVKNATVAGPDAIPFPDDFITWIKSPNSLFKIVASKPIVVGGVKGTQIDATATCGNKTGWINLSGTGWKCPNGEHINFIFLDDISGERVLIQIQGSPSGEDYMFIVEEAQKILDTVVFTKPPTTFSSDKFRLPMSVSFDSDWHVIDDFTDLVTVASSQKDWNVGFNIVTDAKVADPVSGSQIPFPQDFASWIQSNPNFIADEPTEVMVAGIQGLQIDATPTTTKKQDFLYLSGTTWNIIPSPERWRFILLNPINGERLLILLIASTDQFQGAVKEVQTVLNTVMFSKPSITFSPKLVKTPMSVSFGADWQVDYDLPAKFGIWNPHDFGLAFYIVTTAQLADPLDGQLIPFPEDFLAWIKSNPDFTAVTSAPVTVAGIEGVQIDATPIWKSTTTHLKLFLSLSGDKLGNMHGQPDGENIVNDPEQWRFILLDDVYGERVLIILIVGNGHKFEDAVEQSQKVLDTVVFVKL
jgi:hypothetical protein